MYSFKLSLLFKRLYNWIKYKTLPTSYLFKNRLFIERDSKHRRLYSMFGSIFKNSKWGNFETSNLQTKFRIKFSGISSRILVVLVLVIAFILKRYFNEWEFSGTACILGWMLFEVLDYFFVFIVWLSLFLFYAFLNWFYNLLLVQSFDIKIHKMDYKAQDFFKMFHHMYKDQTSKNLKPAFELNGYFYIWLCNPQNTNQIDYFATLFQTKFNKKLWSKQYKFFKQLYKVVLYCNLLNSNLTVTKSSTLINFIKHGLNSQLHTLNHCNFGVEKSNFNNFIRLYLNYQKNMTLSFPQLNSLLQNWNFIELTVEKFALPGLSNITYGNIYFNNVKFSDVVSLAKQNNNLQNMQQIVKNHLTTVKWNRWLYRYSILHRRTLKNSHKLTVTKRLIQSGFYDKKLITQNTWVNHRSSGLKKPLTSHMNFIFYSRFFSPEVTQTWLKITTPTNPYLSQKKKISNFSHYETSFFWFLKRFYIFNTLENNTLKSSLIKKFKLDVSVRTNLCLTPQYAVLMKLSSLYSYNNSDFMLAKNYNHKYESNFKDNLPKNYYNKDVSLLFDDADIFCLETLEFLSCIVNPVNDPILGLRIFNTDFKLLTPNVALNPRFNQFNNKMISLKSVLLTDYELDLLDKVLQLDVIYWSRLL